MALRVIRVMYDLRPDWLQGDDPPTSLLQLPCGTSTLCTHLSVLNVGEPVEMLRVLPSFDPWPGYEDELRRRAATEVALITPAQVHELAEASEPSDWVLFVDPRHVPLKPLDLAKLLPDTSNCWLAKHLIVLGKSAEGTEEFAQLDQQGQVQRIQRYYDGITRMETLGVACSLVPITTARCLPARRFDSLMDLRLALTSVRVPSRDIPLRSGTADLTEESGVLELNEHLVATDPRGVVPAATRELPDGGRIGRRCRIHPSVTISGPVIIQDGVTIEPDAHLIGPTVIGARASIGRSSVIAQCVVSQDTAVAPETTARHRVIHQRRPNRTTRLAGPCPPAFDARNRLNATTEPAGAGSMPGERKSPYPRVKRVLDFVLALTGLALLSPLFLIVGLLVRLTSRGPALFAHPREGRHGKPFRCYKFRTMVLDADAKQRAMYAQNTVDGPQFMLPCDPRVTRLGHWLRKTNLDELPQLFNVLLGHMSLIGPRPSPFRENQICVPWRNARLSVQPGITGLWQVCRHDRYVADFHQWIHYDTAYVRQMSFWLDLKILVATVFTLGGRWSVPVDWMIPPQEVWTWGHAHRVRAEVPIFSADRKARTLRPRDSLTTAGTAGRP